MNYFAIIVGISIACAACSGSSGSSTSGDPKAGIQLQPNVCECAAGIYDCKDPLPVGCGCSHLALPDSSLQCHAIDKVNDVAAYCCPSNTGPDGKPL